MNDINQRLKELRLLYGFTQAQIADKLKIHRTTYTKYETDHIPDVNTLIKLAKIYSLSLDDLFGLTPAPSTTVKLRSPTKQTTEDLDEQEDILVRLFRICDDKNAIIEYTKKKAFESVSQLYEEDN